MPVSGHQDHLRARRSLPVLSACARDAAIASDEEAGARASPYGAALRGRPVVQQTGAGVNLAMAGPRRLAVTRC